MRFNSLRNRFLLLTIVVLLVTGLMSTWFISRAVVERFQGYVANEQSVSQQHRQQLQTMLPSVIEAIYAQSGSLDEVALRIEQMGGLTGERLILLTPQQQVLFDSAAKLDGQPAVDQLAQFDEQIKIPLQENSTVIGTLLIAPIVSTALSNGQQTYINQMNRALMIGIAGAGVIALLLTWALTRSILRPVEALTSAVQRMKSGDLRQRVQVTSKDEIGELATSFNAMADNLDHAERLRRNMVTDVAHELRTPLSNIRGYLEAMQDGVIERSSEAVNSLHEEALLLNRLVDDLQLLAQADAGHLSLVRQPAQIGEIVEKAVHAANHKANGSGIHLHAEIEKSLPLLDIDAERIGQVLRNLLNNAFAYTPHQGEIAVNAQHHNGSVEVTVFNTGQGIANDDLPYLFERFYRADKSRTRSTGGSGLGLAIVKQLIEAHDGKVWVESSPGQWAKFRFVLPVK